MVSPFPGMDPYLEQFWNGVQLTLAVYIADGLNESLPARYRATLCRRMIRAESDYNLAAPGNYGVATAAHSQRLMIRSAALLMYAAEPLKQLSVEIIDGKFGEKVVTAMEVLSPENKRLGDGMVQFRRKQEEYRNARVSRVEIDLLREGRRMFEFPQRILAPEQEKPYYVTVHRGDRAGECELYAIDLRDPLPVIGVPLRRGDADAPLRCSP